VRGRVAHHHDSQGTGAGRADAGRGRARRAVRRRGRVRRRGHPHCSPADRRRPAHHAGHLPHRDHRAGAGRPRAGHHRRLPGDDGRTRASGAGRVTLTPGDSPGFLLWRATLRWQRMVVAALSTMDLTHVQFVLLACAWWLNQRGEVPNQLAVARQAGTDVKMTSQVLRTLEDKGLIERHTDAGDTRAKRVRVTARGAELAPRAIAAVERADAEFFAPVRTDAAVAMLGRLAGLPSPPPRSLAGRRRTRSSDRRPARARTWPRTPPSSGTGRPAATRAAPGAGGATPRPRPATSSSDSRAAPRPAR